MKKEGWEHILACYIDKATHTPFAWGEHDCAIWCAEWVRLATGVDHAGVWRGRYTSHEELLRLMAAAGYTSAEDIADQSGLPVMNVAFAQRGDIVIHSTADSLGICDGRLSCFLTLNGLIKAETHTCRKAWRV